MRDNVFLEHAAERNKSYLPCATLVTSVYGNLGCMKTPGDLADRLELVLKNAGKDRKAVIKELVSLTKLTRQGVTKWFDGGAELKMASLFQVADFLGVDPRWLATGAGQMKAGQSAPCPHTDIPQRRIELIRMYGRLTEDDRAAARRFIETMAYFEHPRRAEYEARSAGTTSITPSASHKPAGDVKPRGHKPATHRND
jgi:hypothetical protein